MSRIIRPSKPFSRRSVGATVAVAMFAVAAASADTRVTTAGERARPATARRQPLSTAAARDVTNARELYGSLPLSFEPQGGENATPSTFLVRGPGYRFSLTAAEIALGLDTSVLRMALVGADRNAAAE